jgi:uncharacterized repeat protein (TIGR03803 family)
MHRYALYLMSAVATLLAWTGAHAGPLTTLHSFAGADGSTPAVFIQGGDGNFYGATALGGSSANCPGGCGTAYRIGPSGTFTPLHTFTGSDGQFPALFLLDTDGNFYGATAAAGPGGSGTVFRMTPGGMVTTLHSFAAGEGAVASGLVRGEPDFYGTTLFGGANGAGTVFRMTAAGAVTTLHSFSGSDGRSPAGIVRGNDGNFYGITQGGGANDVGTVFRLTPDGAFTTLHSFSGIDGAGPTGLIPGSDGNFYGGTESGGSSAGCADGCGTVFRIGQDGGVTTLHSFDGSDGQVAAVAIQGKDGNFYGFTALAGDACCGTLFRIGPSGSFATLHSFSGTDGRSPRAMVQGDDGDLYGTTAAGGANNAGTVFRLSAGRQLVAAVLPSSRSVRVGVPATAFATVINAGPASATGCGISLDTTLPASFTFQATDPATNAIIGAPNARVPIEAGATQTFVIAIAPTDAFPPTDAQFAFACSEAGPAPIISGLNTLLLSASPMPVPDIVALAATPTGDGIVSVPGTNGTGAFAVAAVNVGASGGITASADTGDAGLPVTLSICETNPVNGQCMSSPGASVTTQIDAGATPTFGIFVTGTGNVPFDPATNRIVVRFKDSGGVTRGATSVAVRTQ